MTTESPHWRTSSYSDNGGNCVEVATNLAATRRIVPVRDSKHTRGPVLSLSEDAFASLIAEIKSGAHEVA
ncbi:DUF397 domain-containing protein [Streptomyces sp. NPDC049954]|uniref:DUF397 domain-containing protein n=1 Tax=Streptomyces sp. NPDC049954 TaxID=3155779 RepID=UPI003417F2C2